MPRIKNISGETKKFKNTSGKYVDVADQGELDSYHPYRAVASKIEIANVEPFFNPVVARDASQTGTSFNVAIDSDADYIVLFNNTYNTIITLLRGADDNTPGESILPGKVAVLDVKKFDCGTTLYFEASAALVAGDFLIEQKQNVPY